MEISIDSIDSLSLVTASEYNRTQIDNIKHDYPKLRQQAKAPVFA